MPRENPMKKNRRNPRKLMKHWSRYRMSQIEPRMIRQITGVRSTTTVTVLDIAGFYHYLQGGGHVGGDVEAVPVYFRLEALEN